MHITVINPSRATGLVIRAEPLLPPSAGVPRKPDGRASEQKNVTRSGKTEFETLRRSNLMFGNIENTKFSMLPNMRFVLLTN